MLFAFRLSGKIGEERDIFALFLERVDRNDEDDLNLHVHFGMCLVKFTAVNNLLFHQLNLMGTLSQTPSVTWLMLRTKN